MPLDLLLCRTNKLTIQFMSTKPLIHFNGSLVIIRDDFIKGCSKISGQYASQYDQIRHDFHATFWRHQYLLRFRRWVLELKKLRLGIQ